MTHRAPVLALALLAARAQASPLPFDPSDVVRRARGEPVAADVGFVHTGEGFSLESRAYRVHLDGDGLRYWRSSESEPDLELRRVELRLRDVPSVAFDGAVVGGLHRLGDARLEGPASTGLTATVLHRPGEGVELAWRLDEAWPAWECRGEAALDLVFEVHATAGVRVGTDAVLFGLTGEGVRLTHLVVEDAVGRRLTVPPSVTSRGGRHDLCFTIPAAFLADAVPPLVLDPTVGPEISVDPTRLVDTDQVRFRYGETGNTSEDTRLLENGDHVRIRQLARQAVGADPLHRDQSVGRRVGQRTQQDTVHHREDRRVGPDPQRQRNRGGDDHPRSRSQRPDGILHIEEGVTRDRVYARATTAAAGTRWRGSPTAQTDTGRLPEALGEGAAQQIDEAHRQQSHYPC